MAKVIETPVRKWNEIRPSFIGVYMVIVGVLLIYMLAKQDLGIENDVNRMRTDMEVHRHRTEASHQCQMNALAALPTPDQRQQDRFLEIFVAEYRECVDQLAPTIEPPEKVEVN